MSATATVSTQARRKGRAAVEKKAQALKALEIVYVSVEDLSPNSYNPNRQSEHEFELLKRSMTEDGFTQPVVCVKTAPDSGIATPYTIVDGEHRWRASKDLGYDKIPIVVAPMTLEQARISTLRHNRARGSEDFELAAQVLRDLQQMGAIDWAADSLMLDDVELNRILDDVPAPEALAAEVFSNAWAPGASQVDARDDADGGASQTKAAADALREQEKRIAAAKTEEERQQARKDVDVYRLHLVFSGDEAAIVRAELGAQPAVQVLEWCKAAAAAKAAAQQVGEPQAAA